MDGWKIYFFSGKPILRCKLLVSMSGPCYETFPYKQSTTCFPEFSERRGEVKHHLEARIATFAMQK